MRHYIFSSQIHTNTHTPIHICMHVDTRAHMLSLSLSLNSLEEHFTQSCFTSLQKRSMCKLSIYLAKNFHCPSEESSDREGLCDTGYVGSPHPHGVFSCLGRGPPMKLHFSKSTEHILVLFFQPQHRVHN